MIMKKCENNGCSNLIDVPTLRLRGQCLPCAEKAHERVEVLKKIIEERENENKRND